MELIFFFFFVCKLVDGILLLFTFDKWIWHALYIRIVRQFSHLFHRLFTKIYHTNMLLNTKYKTIFNFHFKPSPLFSYNTIVLKINKHFITISKQSINLISGICLTNSTKRIYQRQL